MSKTMLFNPYSGRPRDPRDIQSDPEGILMLDPDEPLLAAAPTPPAEAASAQREAMLDAMCHAEDHTPSKPDGTTYSQREYMALLLDAALAAKEGR